MAPFGSVNRTDQRWQSPSSGQPRCSIASESDLRPDIGFISTSFRFSRMKLHHISKIPSFDYCKGTAQPKSRRQDVAPLADQFPRDDPSRVLLWGYTKSSAYHDVPEMLADMKVAIKQDIRMILFGICTRMKERWSRRPTCIIRQNGPQLERVLCWSCPACQAMWLLVKQISIEGRWCVWDENFVKYKRHKCGTLFWITLHIRKLSVA